MSFLHAEWKRLAFANYIIDPSILSSDLPAGTELDFWKGDCYVSLVGFMFLHTSLKGVPIPFHQSFEEVNLRYYVRFKSEKGWRRGVVFLRELVPKPAVSLVAKIFFNEPYNTLRMDHVWERTLRNLTVEYRWKYKSTWQRFRIIAEPETRELEEGSPFAFITEHYWGYNKLDDRRTIQYEVSHPQWKQYPVKEWMIDADFGRVFDSRFKFLEGRPPDSIMLAEGSDISLGNKQTLTH